MNKSDPLPEPDLDGFGSLEGLLGGYTHLPLSQQLLDKVGDVAASDRNVLDTAADHIALGLVAR